MTHENLRLIDAHELATLRNERDALASALAQQVRNNSHELAPDAGKRADVVADLVAIGEELRNFARQNKTTAEAHGPARLAMYTGRASAFAWAESILLDKAGEGEAASSARVRSAALYETACDAMRTAQDSGAAHDKELRRLVGERDRALSRSASATSAHKSDSAALTATREELARVCRMLSTTRARRRELTGEAAKLREELAREREYDADVMAERDAAAQRDRAAALTEEAERLRDIVTASAAKLRELTEEAAKLREELARERESLSYVARMAAASAASHDRDKAAFAHVAESSDARAEAAKRID